MAYWVPPYRAWPLGFCAVYGCKNMRAVDLDRDLIRRWCPRHVEERLNEVREQGTVVLALPSLNRQKQPT